VSSSPATNATEDDLLELSVLDLNAVDPRFHTEAQASIARAYEEDHSVDNARLEYRTLIMAYNAPLDTSRAEVSKFLMSQISLSGGAATILQSATKIWTRWGELATSLSSDNANIALDVQRYCVEHEEYRPFFGVILRGLYESDVLAEEDLVEWRSLSEARGDGAKEDVKGVWGEVFLKGKAYVDVLEQMDSESEDEDDDDEDGDDDEDEDEESD
jgi:translation initiation factor eIF-2B subunit epsilon